MIHGRPLSRRGIALLFSVLMVGGRVCAGEEPSDEEAAVVKARAAYAGTWKLVAVESNGDTQPQDARQILVVNRPDGSWIMTIDGDEVSSGRSRMDPLANPAEIDVEFTGGEGEGQRLLAIYEIMGPRRVLCFRDEKGWRPREFRTQVGDGAVLLTFERQATSPDSP
jgi:uncharacterized protein (TIGR03067 family)